MAACPSRRRAFLHAQGRAALRYGLHLTAGLHEEFCRRVRAGEGAVVLSRRRGGRFLVALWVGRAGVGWAAVVAADEGHALVTFLPRAALRPYRRLLRAG